MCTYMDGDIMISFGGEAMDVKDLSTPEFEGGRVFQYPLKRWINTKWETGDSEPNDDTVGFI